MKIVNIWTFLEFMSMANAPTPGQRRMANTLPLGHRKLVNPPPYPGGTLGDLLDTFTTSGTNNIYPYPYIDVNDRGHRLRITHTRRCRGGRMVGVADY